MTITRDYVRDLCGLSTAELPDSVLDNLLILPKAVMAGKSLFTTLVDLDIENPTQEALDQIEYMGYKAITFLESYILVSVPQTIKDNYNSFTRFDTIEQMLEYAKGKVLSFEGFESDSSVFLIVSPATDPVTKG